LNVTSDPLHLNSFIDTHHTQPR